MNLDLLPEQVSGLFLSVSGSISFQHEYYCSHNHL